MGDDVSDNELDKILSLVEIYIRNKQKEKTWIPGKDWVYYAGPYFDSNEYVNGISSLLNGWLVLGKDGETFERKFSSLLGKEKGLLTNSGSSANLLMMAAMASKNLNNLPKGNSNSRFPNNN